MYAYIARNGVDETNVMLLCCATVDSGPREKRFESAAINSNTVRN